MLIEICLNTSFNVVGSTNVHKFFTLLQLLRRRNIFFFLTFLAAFRFVFIALHLKTFTLKKGLQINKTLIF